MAPSSPIILQAAGALVAASHGLEHCPQGPTPCVVLNMLHFALPLELFRVYTAVLLDASLIDNQKDVH